MISVYFYTSFMTIIFLAPLVVISFDPNEKYMRHIEEKHRMVLAQPNHDLYRTLNNAKLQKYFKDYMQAFLPLRGFKKNLILWTLCTAFENFVNYAKDRNQTENIWDEAKSFMDKIEGQENESFVEQLYTAIRSRNTSKLMETVARMRDYLYSSLQTPYKMFHNFFKSRFRIP